MHKITVKKPIITLNDSIPPPASAQSPSLYMTKREQRRQPSNYLTDPNSPTPVKRISLLPSINTSPIDMDYQYEEEEEPYQYYANKKRRASQHLAQLIYNQQQQYETTMQIAALTKEIHFLTDKLYYAEEKVTQWKKDFKNLQAKFNQVLYENNKTNQELQDTRRMLEESEHIRSRWFMKSRGGPPLCQYDEVASTANTFPPTSSKSKKSSLKKSASSYR